ncbi:Phosphate metabolism transcription protein [Monascus purpureus]|uniref:Phosphate metabolism transcription protein n=1 Tax=Monascus purpureus TaxID=5098 RepID=A0A507R049_MONPU|nr:Phosphate metabolism transcription protein [Monascus purpureus]BDD58068.1 hypothetical protein MAP00_003376 [Monascus purpureus]
MRFGRTLRNSVYPPWKDKYIDYQKLKSLLREHEVTVEDDSDTESSTWTEQDEEAFVNELINIQLDKVNAFQVETSSQLRERTSACEVKLRQLVPGSNDEEAPVVEETKRKAIAGEVLDELDRILKEVSELQKYSRINFTGFLKAAKKHDRKRGARYKVKPLLQVRLSQLPLNSEDYSHLVNRISVMYSFVREVLSQDVPEPGKPSETVFGRESYSSYKFWVHADNLLEVKTYILRRLPVLIYRPGNSNNLATIEDPTITSLYFDNPRFDLYNQKVAKAPDAGSLRLRWTGQLKDKPAIFLEKKVLTEDDQSRDVRLQLKEKHIQEFLEGTYRFDKKVHRMLEVGHGELVEADSLKRDVEELQAFIKENNLQPMLRANYTRTAFQIPGDDRIRISLDTNLALIREDCLDEDRPCRDPSQWHRTDIDDAAMEYPFNAIRAGEIARFPHALLEIKLKGNAHNAEWARDLMTSHLVKEAPRFSKFVHGVAQLFDDYVNSFPFWLGELENDIRRDPETAFHEEQERLAKRAEDDMAVGSFMGNRSSPSFGALIGSPAGRLIDVGSPSQAGKTPQTTTHPSHRPSAAKPGPSVEARQSYELANMPSRLASFFPSFPISRSRNSHNESVDLPPGIRHPGRWIKDAGPVRVESKVWLANQRTFIKWLHISVLLSSLSLGLYNAAGKHNDIARALSVVYTFFALFAAAWGWYIYEFRARLIRQRSGQDLDNILGPVVVCLGLAAALVMNFGFKFAAVLRERREAHPGPSQWISSNAVAANLSDLALVNQGGQLL